MTLKQTVEAIKGHEVTELEAQQYASDQFGVLITYVIKNHLTIIYKSNEVPF